MTASAGMVVRMAAYAKNAGGITSVRAAVIISGNKRGAKPKNMKARKMMFHDQNRP
jgi:hypothetical protein